MINVEQRYCKNCGYCIRFCPKQILKFSDERNRRGRFDLTVSDPDKCISCAICATVCPEGAITLPGKGD